MRLRIERGEHTPSTFRAALTTIEPEARDAWLDVVLGFGELPDDGADLPRGCVPYVPCAVDTILEMVTRADVRADDVFVDVGSGLGRAAALVHLLTGATTIGLEIQRDLVSAARDRTLRLRLPVSIVEGDAVQLTEQLAVGSVFFLYCPFGQERLARLLANLEPIARARELRICSVDLPLPSLPWLAPMAPDCGNLTIHRSLNRHAPAAPRPRG